MSIFLVLRPRQKPGDVAHILIMCPNFFPIAIMQQMSCRYHPFALQGTQRFPFLHPGTNHILAGISLKVIPNIFSGQRPTRHNSAEMIVDKCLKTRKMLLSKSLNPHNFHPCDHKIKPGVSTPGCKNGFLFATPATRLALPPRLLRRLPAPGRPRRQRAPAPRSPSGTCRRECHRKARPRLRSG